jgi:hypothetical protein
MCKLMSYQCLSVTDTHTILLKVSDGGAVCGGNRMRFHVWMMHITSETMACGCVSGREGPETNESRANAPR